MMTEGDLMMNSDDAGSRIGETPKAAIRIEYCTS